MYLNDGWKGCTKITFKCSHSKKLKQKKEATEWKRIEKEAGVSARVPADMKEDEVITNHSY